MTIKNHSGSSLVELMIASAIGVFLAATVFKSIEKVIVSNRFFEFKYSLMTLKRELELNAAVCRDKDGVMNAAYKCDGENYIALPKRTLSNDVNDDADEEQLISKYEGGENESVFYLKKYKVDLRASCQPCKNGDVCFSSNLANSKIVIEYRYHPDSGGPSDIISGKKFGSGEGFANLYKAQFSCFPTL